MIRSSGLVVVAEAGGFLRSSRMADRVIPSRLRGCWGQVGTKRIRPGELVRHHTTVWIHRLVNRTESLVIIHNGSVSTGRTDVGS
jgi:hypothetical protein